MNAINQGKHLGIAVETESPCVTCERDDGETAGFTDTNSDGEVTAKRTDQAALRIGLVCCVPAKARNPQQGSLIEIARH